MRIWWNKLTNPSFQGRDPVAKSNCMTMTTLCPEVTYQTEMLSKGLSVMPRMNGHRLSRKVREAEQVLLEEKIVVGKDMGHVGLWSQVKPGEWRGSNPVRVSLTRHRVLKLILKSLNVRFHGSMTSQIHHFG